MRIAILGTKGVPGRHGVEVVVDSLIPHLAQLGHEVTVYGYQGYAQDTDDYHGARIVTVPGSSNKNLEMISHMWSASLATRREAYDIVHVHSVDPCLIAWLPRSRLGVVATSHGQAYLRKKWSMPAKIGSKLAERCFMRLPKAITSVSKPLADYYKARYGREVLYIPNGVQSRPIPEERWLDKWGLKSRGFLFCSAGRVERTKGLHTLLAAYARLKPGHPLIIAGGGSGSDPAYQQELNRDKAEGVRFVGFLTGEEFHALYAHARVFVFPSEYEAMSMALLEGLSFGCRRSTVIYPRTEPSPRALDTPSGCRMPTRSFRPWNPSWITRRRPSRWEKKPGGTCGSTTIGRPLHESITPSTWGLVGSNTHD